jgi:type II secretory pathway component PulK
MNKHEQGFATIFVLMLTAALMFILAAAAALTHRGFRNNLNFRHKVIKRANNLQKAQFHNSENGIHRN